MLDVGFFLATYLVQPRMEAVSKPMMAATLRSLLMAYDVLLAYQPASSTDVDAALGSIQELVTSAALAKEPSSGGTLFLRVQKKPEWNTTSVLLQWLATTCRSHSSSGGVSRLDLLPVDSLATAFTLIQGLLHLHPGSQRLFSRRPNVELLLRLLPSALTDPALEALSLPLLSLLLPTFLDSPYNTHLFETMGGLETLVKVMKDRNARKEVRMMVVEVVWGWWMGEGGQREMPDFGTMESEMDARAKMVQAETDVLSEMPRTPHRARPVSAMVTSANAFQLGTQHFSESSSTPRRRSHVSDSPKARGRARFIAEPVRLLDPITATSEPAATPASRRTRPVSLPPPTSPPPPRTSTPVPPEELVLRRDPREVPLPETPRSNRLSTVDPVRPALTPSAASDPAIRLRSMLENTVGNFVPATPHRPKSGATPRKRVGEGMVGLVGLGTPSNGEGRRIGAEIPRTPSPPDVAVSSAVASAPKLLFPSPSSAPAPSTASAPRSTSNEKTKVSTPQRVLRHKQSASLGSIQWKSGASPFGAPATTDSPTTIEVSPDPRLAASAASALLSRHRTSASMTDLRPSSSSRGLAVHLSGGGKGLGLTPSPSTPSGLRRIPNHRSRMSMDLTPGSFPHSPARYSLDVVAEGDSPGSPGASQKASGASVSPVPPATPMRSAAGRALEASFIRSGSGLKRSATTPLLREASQEPFDGGDEGKENGRARRPKSPTKGVAVTKQPAKRSVEEEEKRVKLGRHMSNVDQLVRRFTEMREGLHARN